MNAALLARGLVEQLGFRHGNVGGEMGVIRSKAQPLTKLVERGVLFLPI